MRVYSIDITSGFGFSLVNFVCDADDIAYLQNAGYNIKHQRSNNRSNDDRYKTMLR